MLTEEKKRKFLFFFWTTENLPLLSLKYTWLEKENAWGKAHCDETDPQEKGHETQLSTN